jgi:hypothetical protein
MGEILLPAPCLYIVAVSSRHDDAFQWAVEKIAAASSPCALKSPLFQFSETDYYEPTMGPELRKQFFAMQELIDPAELTQIKVQSNRWEHEYASGAGHPETRPLNLDPGYLTLGKLVLASTKDHSHRIYLADGIYAEGTLYYKDKRWQHREWTFPDYRREDYHAFFSRCRDYLKGQLRKGPSA